MSERHPKSEHPPVDLTDAFVEGLENPQTREEYLTKLLQMTDYHGEGEEAVVEEVRGLVRRLAEGSADRLVDPLTELPNNRAFEAELGIALERFQRSDGIEGFDLVMIDLVDFGSINKSHGFSEGDRVLREFADLLQSTRTADTFYRSGTRGDEFYGLVASGSGEALVERLRQRGRAEVSRPDERPLELYAGVATASRTASPSQETGKNAQALLDAADARLREDYRSCHEGTPD